MNVRLPVVTSPGAVLCQTQSGSCAACCGLYNFADRTPEATHARLHRRTAAFAQAGWNAAQLKETAAGLAALESAELLFLAVKTCPLAGYLDPEETRVGCLIHPLRHPQGEDLRDLGAYADKNICSGHLCAPHQWLGPAERALLQHAGTWHAYSMAIGESGYVKAVLRVAASRRGTEVKAAELQRDVCAAPARALLDLFERWPYADPDPRRFGGFSFSGDDAYTRLVPSTARFSALLTPSEAVALDCLGTRAETETQAQDAVSLLRERVDCLVKALDGDAREGTDDVHG